MIYFYGLWAAVVVGYTTLTLIYRPYMPTFFIYLSQSE